MYLKSIDIVGYKSFALRTRVDLEPGITGIIGPNGCGKSNIMEAVRWCLGEMSWKSLRADAMIDVIFSGTSKRQPLSMTEVTLTFDNASQMLPVQFSEVTITRRIYRSGESAYFMNKTQCRLRDIREMFLDTGVGGDGYAIIDQGGVDAMITSKPEERRAFFEEAAGVAKYNSKREEALRKLERVEMDMGRLQDSVSLIDEQVKKLDNDARKAKLYQKYKEELAAAEAAHMLLQIGTIQADLESLAVQVAPLEETLGAKRAEMTADGANLAAHNLEKANQQNQLIACNQKIAEVKSEIGRLEERANSAGVSITETEARQAACELELEALRQRCAGIDPEIERSAAAAAEAEAARAAAEAEAGNWQSQLQTLQQKLRDAEQGLQRLRQESLAAADAALSQRRRVGDGESTWSRQEMQARGSLRELDRDLTQVQSCQTELEPARQLLEQQRAAVGAARQETESAEAAVADLRRRHAELGNETLRLHSDLAQFKARAESLEAQGGQNPYWVGAQTVINAAIPGVVGTVRQLFKIDEPYKAHLEDLLGERLYAVVCEDSTAARTAVELLEASGKGRARFLILSSLPSQLSDRQYPEESRPLLRHAQFDPAHEKAVKFLLSESYALGKTLFGDHWVFGGSAERESLQLSLADVQDIRAKASACETRAAELAAAKALCESEIAAAENRARSAAVALNAESGREQGLVAQISEKESGLTLSLRNAELSTAEAARILAEMALTKERIHELRRGIAESEQAEVQAKARETEAAQSMGVLREELARGEATQELLQSRLQSVADKLSFLIGAHERLVGEKESLQGTVARRVQEIEDLGVKKQEARAVAAESRARLEELGVEFAARENEAKAVFERLRELEAFISEREASLRSLKQICEDAQLQLHQLELKVSGQRGTQDVLKKRLWDDWQLTYEEAKHKYDGQPVDTDRIEFLRKRIVSLGNVNMAAPEEYIALSERQVFLANQIHDLNQAKEDLKAAIFKINNATRENFRLTFTEVREHFRRLYGVLFEGGEADLVLTDPENILETGVDIVAQPPGKRLQSISLLSGGEKTLTAIALLFAFFMVKPSPFCMLDEADAALDDANVERFVALLKEFQKRSQFLIVSHNKRTMEAADVIYGVTMEEMGVSQLVSVDFRKKERHVSAENQQGPATHGPFERARSAPAAPAAVSAPAASEAATATAVAELPAAALTEIVAEAQDAPAAEPIAESPAVESAAAVEPIEPPMTEEAAAVEPPIIHHHTPEGSPMTPAALGMVGTSDEAPAAEPGAEAGAEASAELPAEPDSAPEEPTA